MISAPKRWISTTAAILTVVFCFVLFSTDAAAQAGAPNTGSVTGRVLDVSTGQPLPSVAVQVVGLAGVGTNTNAAGQFTIAGIPAGTVTLQFRRLGFAAKTVTGISLRAGEAMTVDATLDPNANILMAEVVSVAAERGSVHEALNTQRNSVAVTNTITSDQIGRSTDGDAAAATQRVAGLTITDGKYPNARGQQDRSTIANLNNVRIPSPEPEKKQVPFDMFPASLIRAIEVTKTFTPDMPGDFSGALVNIQTREFPARKTVSYSTSVGLNSGAFGKQVLSSPVNLSERFAFASGSRQLPSVVRAAGNFNERQYAQSEINQMIGSFRNSWTPSERKGAPSTSFGMSMGGNDPILGRQIGYIGSLTYSVGQEVRVNERRALIDYGTGNTPANEFVGSTGRSSVLWGGLLNLSSFIGDKHLITLNNMYNRTSDAEAHRDSGRDEGYGVQNILERTTLSYVERSVRSNQLSGLHPVGSKGELNWSVTNSAVTRREPDRSDMVYITTQDPVSGQMNAAELFTASSDGARRTFADLSEGSWNISSDYELSLGDPFLPRTFKFGGLFRTTSRDAEVLQYSFATLLPLQPEEAARSAEEIFDGRFTSGAQSTFTINPLGQSGSYSASDQLAAGYAMAEYGVTESVRLVGGARVENSNVEVVTTNFFGFRDPVRRTFTDVLPSLAVTLSLSDNHQLRLSAARTLARPEYRELSPILNRDVLGGQGFRGDTSLVRTLIDNYDMRWEWYPNPGEVVSIALFAKNHDRPIERVEVPTSGTSVLSYINAESAQNLGVEFEFRKELGNIVWALEPLSVFGNVTLMSSEIRLGETGSASATNSERPLAGQAPYVINAGLTYSAAGGETSATAMFNRVGKRITAAGPLPLPDVYEMPRNVVDVALRFPLPAGISGKLDFKNVLDAPVEHRQGAVTRLYYTTGRSLSFGLGWKP